MQTLAHDFFLLSLDDHTGESLVKNSLVFNAAIAAAWVGEMMFQDRLVSVDADKFALRAGPLSPGLLGKVEGQLVDKKPSPLGSCITGIRGFWGNINLVGWVQDDLVERGVLRKEADTLWFITYKTRHPTADITTEESIRERLQNHLITVTDADPPHRDDALISLLRAAKILDQVWAQPDELARLRPLILERTKRAPLGLKAKEISDAEQILLTVAVIS
jgi:hypothetical protein